MKELEELIGNSIEKVENYLENKIKKSALKKGFDLNSFTKKELKKRCSLFYLEELGYNYLEIDGYLICSFTYPKPKEHDFKEPFKISFEYKYGEP